MTVDAGELCSQGLVSIRDWVEDKTQAPEETARVPNGNI